MRAKHSYWFGSLNLPQTPVEAMIYRNFRPLLLLILSLGLFACASADPIPVKDDTIAPYVHVIKKGNVLNITVFGEDDISGSYTVDNRGMITFPMVEDIVAVDMTAEELRENLTAALAEDYLINPSLRIEVAGLAPIYVLGEVNKPGSYQYSDSINVLKAVALAGGFTYRAYKKRFDILRAGDDGSKAIRAHAQSVLYPGDTLVVKERFF